jgi:hypothetical protein
MTAFQRGSNRTNGRAKKAARERMTNGFRKKIKRLKGKLSRLHREGDAGQSRKELVESLQQMQEARRTLRKRVLIAQTDWSSKATVENLYKRICTKFGDNVIKKWYIEAIKNSAMKRTKLTS